MCALVLRRTWGYERHWRGRAWAWAGLGLALGVLAIVAVRIAAMDAMLKMAERLTSPD